jgi:hypothetical protein
MRRASLVLAMALAFGATNALAKPPHRAVHHGHVTPPITSLMTIARVRIEVARDRVVVIEDVTLPRGEWQKGDMDLYVAFGAPGAPKAFDARVLSLKEGELEAAADDAGDPVTTEHAPHKPPGAQMLIGRSQMAGAVVHLKEAQYRRALTASGAADTAVIRTRTLLDLPAEDAQTGRELVVRLGITGETPLTLGRVQLVSLEPRPWFNRAEAQLCGPEADPWPLAMGVLPKLAPTNPPAKGPIVPRMALRHATDDLCVRFWTAQ